MDQYRLEPFDLERALAGEPVCDCHGNDIDELTHFKTVDPDGFCIAAVLGVGENARLLVYSLYQARRDMRIKTTIKAHPFDPEKLSEGWIVRTDDGRAVTQLTVFDIDAPYRVYGVVGGQLAYWDIKGAWYYSGVPQNLVMYPPE